MVLKLLKKIAEYSWTTVFCVFNALGPVTFSVTTAIVFPVLRVVAPRFLVKLMCYFADTQWRYFANGVEHWGRAKFHFYGHKSVPDRENCILVMNHISILDWLYVLNIAGRRGRMGCVKFFAKDSVKYWPGFGWGIYFLDSVFLKRDWMRDQASIRRTFEVLRTRKLPFWLVSFLEGTRATSQKILESQKFCQERNLPILKHMLFPRTKGFVATIQGLRDSTDSVLDVTFACDGGRVPSVVDLAMRRMPDFHVHVRRYPIKEVPTDEEEITQWIIKRFVEKDELLSYFHKNGKFPDPAPKDLWPVPYQHKALEIWDM